MALRYALRRAAPKFLPSSAPKFRPSAAPHRYFHHHQPSTLLLAAVASTSPNFFHALNHRFSTRSTSDESLLRVIESEIQCAEESQDSEQVTGVPSDFPFEIEDNPGEQTITLTTQYQDENITVEVHMPHFSPEGEEEDGNGNEGEQRENPLTLPLVVRVSKKGGPILEFSCTASADEIAIDSLSVKNPDSSEDQLAYEGPDFADLDENLQKAFHKYLEVRGIKPSTTNFLHEYMVDKDNREYSTWLKNLQKFVRA